MANTGIKIYMELARVNNLTDKLPVDVNGELCSISLLPQDTKPNDTGDPKYAAPVTDLTTCPLSTPPSDVSLTYSVADNPLNASEWVVEVTLSAALTVNIAVDAAFNENYLGTLTGKTTIVTVLAGQTLGENTVARDNTDSTADNLVVNDVSPNPAGGVTITYI